MATKLEMISVLSERTTMNLTDNHINWTSFLKTAALNYKYSFFDQVLIYAQRPNATACAEIDTWNSQLKRWVKKGAKGIALIKDGPNGISLRHVFDISDTYDKYNRPIHIWQMERQFHPAVIESLENAFGELESNRTLNAAIISASNNAVDDNISDYLSGLINEKEHSLLEELDELNIEVHLKELLKNSVAYMVLSRCGVNADEMYSFEDFFALPEFNTVETITILGTASSEISETVLNTIGDTVKKMNLQNRTFANREDLSNNKDNNNTERNDLYDRNSPNLSDSGRLSNTESENIGNGNGDNTGSIGSNAQEISEREQESSLQSSDDNRQTDEPLQGYRGDGEGANGIDYEADGTGTGRDGTAQSDRPDEMGGDDEFHQGISGGDRTEGTDFQLDLFPTVEEQMQNIEKAEEETNSAFSISNGNLSQADIDSVLQNGSGFADGKYRIYEHFTEGLHSSAETIEFLKKEYGIGGGTHFYPDGTRGHEWHDAKGIGIEKYGTFTKPDRLLKWNEVAKRLSDLIAIDHYLNDKEKEHYPIFKQEQLEKQLQYQEEQAAKAIFSTAPDEKERLTYSLGDTVFIGADEYEIMSFDENKVVLFDTKYPMFNKELPKDEFERKLRENGLNDHLKGKTPVGRIDHIGFAGEVVESQEYENAEDLEQEIRDRAHIGEPFEAAIYNGSEQISSFLETFPKEDYKAKEENITPLWSKGKSKAQVFDIHPEIPLSERHNYIISNDLLGIGTPRQKFENNIAAITLLKLLEEENRFATPEEQKILSQYVGWGGLSDAFDQNKWPNEYLVLKSLLDEQEYSAARESTLSAFYTPPVVIKAMYQAIENMGFKTGNILEPSCGIGNFFGLLPESLQNCKTYGIELDSITGRIAQQLYQKSSIAVKGYEKTNLPDSFFDVSIGNVPFGQFKVADKRYDKNNFLIHDYFFAKTLDKIRPGGIVAFITSKGTMDKENPAVRKYIAQRADLLGAIRLPNNTFKANAGTEVTADIIFLQKRDRLIDIEPDWVHLGKDENGITMNQYFTQNPDMLMGEMVMESTQYGMDSTCRPYDGADIETQLSDAIANIHAEITEYEAEDLEEEADTTIPADPSVRNFSFTLVDDKIYFRENSRMKPLEAPLTTANRVKEMIKIRDCVRALIEYQTEDYDDCTIQAEQKRLNNLYDSFNKKYGLINSRANSSAFSDDSSYCLLCSLEVIDENGDLVRKADMFTKRTIKQRSVVTSVDTAVEALALSLAEKATVDIGFMSILTGKTEQEVFEELKGIIFLNPLKMYEDDNRAKYLTADEYLSGNVREKLGIARYGAEFDPEKYLPNVKALEQVQPVDLTASEISVRLGATWIHSEIYQQFMFELLSTPRYNQWNIKVHYSEYTSQWNIEGKSYDRGNIKANSTFGTGRMNAYKIIEETLNLKDVRIFDTIEDADGKKTQVLNKKETAIAQSKQELIKSEFAEWIWKDPDRREKLTRVYNEKFNSNRPREYDGSHLHFSGINPEITLRPHQVNAVAHILYGGNTLLAHEVGAGKSATRS